MGKLLITYKKSTIGYSEDQKRTVISLGLHKLHQSVVQQDNASVRGMIFRVRHLVTFEEVADDYTLPVRQPHARPRVIGQADKTSPTARVEAPRAVATAPMPAPASETAPVATTPAVESTAEAEGVAEQQGFAPAALTLPKAESSAEAEGVAIASIESDAEPVATLSAAHTDAADDIELIEGIGPKIAEALREGGVTTFAQLAALSKGEIEAIIDVHPTLRSADPTTWPEQARLAADGNWDEFKLLTERLKGGRAS